MAKITRSNSLSALHPSRPRGLLSAPDSRLVEGDPTFTAGANRFSIGLTSREGKVTYHVHLGEDEAQRFAAFVAEHTKIGA
jgi:hypothetical protein